VSSAGFLIRFLLGLSGSVAVLSVAVGLVLSSPRTEAHVLGAAVERGAPISVGRSIESRGEPRFGQVASALAGKHVHVRCWSRSAWPRLMRNESAYTRARLNSATLGLADIGGARINLSPAVCGALVELVDQKSQPLNELGQLRLAAALVTLAHEPQHSKGIANEAVAECNAIQLAPATARELGLSRRYAASLVRAYWRHYGDELPEYRSTECRKGGALDLYRADSIWP
jgi:hypothetical protein